MKRKKASKGILVDVAMLLVCLVCITSCISSGILAKYATGTKTKDLGRPASFKVSAVRTSGDDEAEITDDRSYAEYEVKVTNDSETAVSYDITLYFSEEIKGIVTVEFGGETYGATDEDKKTIEIKNAGTLADGGAYDTVTFKLVVDLDAFTASFESGEANIDFDTMVRFTQID